jgi:aryl-alcohol dehydrogenase-like predicted oxidoreductase
MQYRRLGRTGLQVSALSYGAAWGASEDEKTFTAAVHTAIEGGINFVDTAADYSDSERALGQALEGHDEVVVQTKYQPYDGWGGDAAYIGSATALTAAAEESLRRLRRDRLDILLGHGIRSLTSLDRFMHDGCYAAMVRLRDQGKVRFIGISELSTVDGSHEVLKRAIPTGAFDVVMVTLNFLLQSAAESVLPLSARFDVGTAVMMPLNQGTRESGLVSVPAALECVRRHVAAGHLPATPPYTEPDLFDFLRPDGVPAAALRYVLAHDVSTCCVGTRSAARVRENLSAVDPPYLDDDRLTELRALFGSIQQQLR